MAPAQTPSSLRVDRPESASNSTDDRDDLREDSREEGRTDVEPLHRHVCAKIRDLRRQRGWTLEQLAAQSGVSRSMLSQVERGVANPTLSVAFRIAQAFGLSLEELVAGALSNSRIEVIRTADLGSIFRNDACCRIRTLSPLDLEKDVEFYEVVLHARQTLNSAAHFEGTREFITVTRGSVQVTSGDETILLKRGDSAQYPADVHHAITNVQGSEACFFLVDIYSTHR